MNNYAIFGFAVGAVIGWCYLKPFLVALVGL